jgi:hypothetical protein
MNATKLAQKVVARGHKGTETHDLAVALLSQGHDDRQLRAEWWELWWVRPGSEPIFVPMYGAPALWWVPDGCYPTRALALHEKKRRANKFDRIVHIRRYRKVKP